MSTVDDGQLTRVIRQKLTDFFQPVHLEVECESRLHNVPSGCLNLWAFLTCTEAHFRVQIVSDKFDGLKHLDRQRMVNKVLETEMQNGIHAIRIDAKKPGEYHGQSQVKPPACGGGHPK
ncbi:hypothetical protein M3Y98_00694900 [Aphelenchoides besseyi]|nr:hypothetical protein M3Y98_00694900 [Aphelenchoides besseyi]